MTPRRRRIDVPDVLTVVGLCLIAVSLWGVDWRLAAGVMGLLLVLIAIGGHRIGRRR